MGFRTETRTPIKEDQIDSYRVAPQGISEVHTRPSRDGLAINQNVSDGAYAAAYPVITHNSHTNHLEAEFHGAHTVCDHQGTSAIIPTTYTPDGRLAVVAQAAGYAERSALIVASNRGDYSQEELQERGHRVEPAYFSADLPYATRTVYVGSTLAGLQVAAEHALDEVPVAIEHNTPTVSQKGASFPRSIPRPHTSLVLLDVSQFKPRDSEIPHLQQEQEMLTDEMKTIMALQMYAFIRGTLGRRKTSQLAITPRDAEPVGFGMHFRDITQDNLTEPASIKMVTRVLNAAHTGYRTFTKSGYMEGPQRTQESFRHFFAQRPQPATRLIYHLHPEQQHLVVAVSPIASRAGGMEAMGIDLRRGVEYPRIHSPEDVLLFQKDVGARIQATNDRLKITRPPWTGQRSGSGLFIGRR